jgi:unsaturated rhamnogalacturonyl hydrolase
MMQKRTALPLGIDSAIFSCALLVAACGNSGSPIPNAGTSGTNDGTSGSGAVGGTGTAPSGGANAGGAPGTGGIATGTSGASSAGSSGAGATAGADTSAGGASLGGTGGAAGSGGAPPAFDRAAVQAIMRRVADYEISRFGTGNDNGWVRAVFHTGMLAAYRALGDTKYRDYTLQWGQANSWRLASTDLRFADNQACVQSYAELYLADAQPANLVMIAPAQVTFDTMVAAPRQGRVEWWWCDSLFMAPPALARVAKATGKTEYLTLLHNMFWDTTAFLYNPAVKLFWRDGTFLNQDVYWSRGNGWVVAGIARLLEVLPADDARRPDYENLLRDLASTLRTVQASDGFWRSSLTHPEAFTNPESSGTAFFCYGLAWGIHHGVLDRATYLPTVSKAWNALVSVVSAQGRLGWVQAVGLQPGPATADSTNDYATGALLLSGSELLAL